MQFGFKSELFYEITLLFVSMEVANRKIVEYIRDTWVIPMNNNNRFATENNIDEKTVRRIREDDTYQISLITIMRICEAQNIKLSKFFEMAGL